MNDDALSLQGASFAVVGAAYLVYAVWLGMRRRSAPRIETAGKLLLAAVACSSLWGWMALVDLQSTKVWTWHAAEQLDQARYALWGLFLLSLLSGAGAWSRVRLSILLGLLGVGAGINLWAGVTNSADAWTARAFTAVHLAWPVLTVALVEQVYRNEDEHNRWGIKPLCFAIAALCAYDIFAFSEALMFGRPDPDAMAARGIVHALVVPLLVVASVRQTDAAPKVRVSNAAAFYSASLLLIGVYLLGVAAVGYYIRYFGGTWGGVAEVVIGFGSLVILLSLAVSGSWRARLRVFLSKHFLRYRYDYRREWLRFTTMLSAASSPQEVGVLVTRGLADMVESPAGSLWFRALGDDAFVQTARWNLPASQAQERPDSPFCTFLREQEWIVDLHDPPQPRNEAPLPPPPAWLTELGSAWLVVPLLVGDNLLGFVVLAEPRTAFTLNWETRDLLKTAARQAAAFLAQMHATEALLESRKFDAFNRMSAFVVHDLKNIVTQLSLMMKNAERHRGNPEFEQDMLLTVDNALEKMRQLMLQLREGAKPAGAASGVELKPLLQRVAAAAKQRGRTIELDIVDRLATRGHEDRLERVIGHVVQNALDATPASGRVWVTLRQSSGRAMLVVGDTGVGMSPEFIRTRLFRPFSSTKSSGMGIGSYESFQYVKELGGSIEVQSEPGKGSVVTLVLPLFDLKTTTDLGMAGAK
jgi:putative PEP-CTERM system histidine kinase